jgi:hypothetical protein
VFKLKKSTNGNYHALLLYWRVKFDLPPLNIFGPKNLPQLNEIIARLEADEHVTGTDIAEVLSGYASLHHVTPADVTEMGFSESTSNNRENGLRCLIPVPERKMGAWPLRWAFAN